LHVLALFEGLKGLLALVAAASLEVLGPQPLRNLIAALIAKFNLDPAHGTLPSLLDAINPGAVHLAVAVVSLYAVWRLVEAWGLWRAKAWASWLGCVGTAAYLPLDLYALYHHHGWHTWAVLLVNLLVVAVLARDLHKRRQP
jgi:uncharacterized membrane protein (DUF2068 family)